MTGPLRSITVDATKYYYVVAALDQATALRVIDVFEDPPQFNKYDNLKRRLTDIFGLSRRQRAGHLLEFGAHSLGDMRPSQLMYEMLGMLGAHNPCMLFENIFLKAMPEDIRLQIATADFTDPRALAKTADELWQAKERSTVFVSQFRPRRNTLPRTDDTRQRASDKRQRENETATEVSATTTRDSALRRGSATPHARSRETTEPVVSSGCSDRPTEQPVVQVDGNSNKRFLVDTGASVSVFPASYKHKHSGIRTSSLIAANASNIATYGSRYITTLGLNSRNYTWSFIIADVKTPLLEADFLDC